MALSTDDPTLATTTEPQPTRTPMTDPSRPPHGRRNAVLGWAGVGIAVAAVAALAIAVLRPETSTPVHDNSLSRVVAEHGSISAIEHRDELKLAANSESRVVAEHGSVSAIEHRDELKLAAGADNSESRVVAEHGSVSAIEHRDQPDAGAPTSTTGG